MKHFYVFGLYVICMLVCGCVPHPQPTVTGLTSKNNDSLQGITIRNATVHDMQYSNYKVEAQPYQEALSCTIKEVNDNSSDTGEGKVDVFFLCSGKPVPSPIPPTPYLSAALSVWKIDDGDSPCFYINSTAYTARSGFVGSTRMKNSVEGALRDNISEGLHVCSLSKPEQTAACSKSLVILVPKEKKVREIGLTNLETKETYQIFKTTDLFQMTLPAGEYEMSRLAIGLARRPYEFKFTIEPNGVYIVDGDLFVAKNEVLSALGNQLTKIDRSLSPKIVQLMQQN